MPELPEVETLARVLSERATGRVVESARLVSFAALKTVDPPLTALVGRTVGGCERRGKFLLLHADPVLLAVHLARAGWVAWHDALPEAPPRPGRGPLALRLGLSGGAGLDVLERGTEKRLALHVVRDAAEVPGIARLGVDVLDPAFDAAALGRLLASRPGHVKQALADQALIAGVGNAYSDEALHVARLSPFKPAASLTAEEVGRLHAALLAVLQDALDRSRGLGPEQLKSEKRSGMRVHGRTGLPCPDCGDTVREVSFATRSWQYCPTCQTGGRILADRRLSRLLR